MRRTRRSGGAKETSRLGADTVVSGSKRHRLSSPPSPTPRPGSAPCPRLGPEKTYVYFGPVPGLPLPRPLGVVAGGGRRGRAAGSDVHRQQHDAVPGGGAHPAGRPGPDARARSAEVLRAPSRPRVRPGAAGVLVRVLRARGLPPRRPGGAGTDQAPRPADRVLVGCGARDVSTRRRPGARQEHPRQPGGPRVDGHGGSQRAWRLGRGPRERERGEPGVRRCQERRHRQKALRLSPRYVCSLDQRCGGLGRRRGVARPRRFRRRRVRRPPDRRPGPRVLHRRARSEAPRHVRPRARGPSDGSRWPQADPTASEAGRRR
mmetsp:Transcript_18652/g.60269  ORF Transcript_18652/g.60269 Transcript_18652/m.60269 type:complete len:318 (-) Transcript_18652:3163-4116(-)